MLPSHRTRRIIFLCCLCLLLGLVVSFCVEVRLAAQSPARTAAARVSPPLDTARRHYRRYCARCHDSDFTGNEFRRLDRKVPDFTDRAWQESRTDAQLLVSILEGKGTHMPGFNGKLTEELARDLVRLIRSVQPPRQMAAETTPTDFSKRYAELLKELEELRKEFRDLSRSLRKSESNDR